jgi:hypothetical protein
MLYISAPNPSSLPERAKGEVYHEVAPQLIFMAYLQRVVNGGGFVDREYGIGRLPSCSRSRPGKSRGLDMTAPPGACAREGVPCRCEGRLTAKGATWLQPNGSP